MPKTRAQENRSIRQEALREQLSNKGLVQKVIETARELSEPEGLTSQEITAKKHSADIRLKLIDKYLPSLQSVESTIETVDKTEAQLTDAELEAIAKAGSERATSETDSKKQVH